MSVKFIAITILTLLHFYTYGQIVGTYTADNGLAQGFVTTVAQSRNGFIWAGTNNGLSRFDGVHFRTFRMNAAGSQSLYSNQIQKLVKDTQGRLWVVNGGRIQLLNEQKNTFFTPEYCIIHPETVFSKTFVDPAGHFWVLSDDRVLCLRPTDDTDRPDLKEIAEIRLDLNQISTPNVLLHIDSVVWLGAGNGLFQFRPSSGTWTAVWQKNGARVTQLWTDKNFGGVWMFTSAGAAWIHEGQWRWFPELNSGRVVKGGGLFFEHKTWLVDAHHVYEWDGKDMHTRFSNLPFEIVSAGTDDQGFLWLGSDAKGLFQINLKDNNINTLWAGDLVTEPVYKDAGGQFLSLKGKGCSPLQTAAAVPAWYDAGRKIKSLAVDASGRTWYFDCNNILTGPDANFHGALKSLPANTAVNRMRCLPDGNIIIIKSRSVLMLNPLTGQEVLLEADAVKGLDLKGGFEINSIKAGLNGTAWLGVNEGVLQLSPVWHSGAIACQFFPTAGMFASPAVLSLELGDTAGTTIFLGTLNGFYRWQPTGGQCQKVVTRDIVADEVVYCMQKDLSGRIWLGTNAGLKMYDPTENISKCFTNTDGLPASEFNRNTESISRDGEILMGTVKGAVRFFPDVLSQYTRSLRLAFTDILLNDSLIEIPAYHDIVRLHADDALSIGFMLLDFGPPSAHKFRYRLTGVSEHWEFTDQPSVTYAHLSPGRYVFEVSGSNSSSGWSEPCRMEIHIERPLWETFGLLLLVMGLGAGLVYFFYRNLRNPPVVILPSPAMPLKMEEEPAPDNLVHKKVLALVEMYFRESEFNVSDIQEKLKISKVHLHRKMIEETGKTAAYFLKKRRMDEALKLLKENPEMTIAQVAYASGFSDPNYFSTVFTSSFGKSPKKFREDL